MSDSAIRRSGLVCVVTGLLGGALAILLLVWPTGVDEDLMRYPFSESGFLAAQIAFSVHHLGLVVGTLALALSGVVGPGRIPRAGAYLLVLGTLLLTAAELLTIRYANWAADDANAGLMGTAYAVSCTVIGLGAIVAGVGVLRTKAWTGWHAWTPMVIGVAQFVMLTPGMFGGFVIARLVIGAWMLMFGALGWSLYVKGRGAVRGERSERAGASSIGPGRARARAASGSPPA